MGGELKPCPFCNGTHLKLRQDYSEDKPVRAYAWHVFCEDCHCHGRNNFPIGWVERKEDAVDAWNRRAAPLWGEQFWIIVHDRGCTPERKGAFKRETMAATIREFIRARPTSLLTVLTVGSDGTPDVQHAPEALQMLDGRSMALAREHNRRVREASPLTGVERLTAARDRWNATQDEAAFDELGAAIDALAGKPYCAVRLEEAISKLQDKSFLAGLHQGEGTGHEAEAQAEADLARSELIDALAGKPPAEDGWLDISTAPKDGTAFLGIGTSDKYPHAMEWTTYDDEVAEETGEEGYWSYCEALINEVTGGAEPTHWQPLPAPPNVKVAP